jgi:CBS domain-containing protein
MICADLFSNIPEGLRTTDSGLFALGIMDEHKVYHLPVIDNMGKYLGLISEDDILDMERPEDAIADDSCYVNDSAVLAGMHVYHAIQMMHERKISVLPVVDERNNYLGLITRDAAMAAIYKLLYLDHPAGLVILEVNKNEYSMLELAKIVESDNARILSCYVFSDPESARAEITLRINREDLSSIMAAFERFNYTVLASYAEDRAKNDTKDRFDLFMKYLNM